MRFEKIMVIGRKIPHALTELLLNTGSRVTRLSSGETAVSHAQREMFDAAIIVSTGDEMDAAETIFNLSDINSAMHIILVSDRLTANEPKIPKDFLERVVPNIKVMSLEELRSYFNSEQKETSHSHG